MPPNSYRLRWSDAAAADVTEIWSYYADVGSRDVANRVLNRIEEAGDKAARAPFLQRARVELGPGLRAVVVSPHILFYAIEDQEVIVVRVLHGARDIEAIFKNEEPDA
jgi:toxin ParE1/3/4